MGLIIHFIAVAVGQAAAVPFQWRGVTRHGQLDGGAGFHFFTTGHKFQLTKVGQSLFIGEFQESVAHLVYGTGVDQHGQLIAVQQPRGPVEQLHGCAIVAVGGGVERHLHINDIGGLA